MLAGLEADLTGLALALLKRELRQNCPGSKYLPLPIGPPVILKVNDLTGIMAHYMRVTPIGEVVARFDA